MVAIVQTQTNGFTSNTSGSLTISSTTAGNALIVMLRRNAGSGGISIPSATGVTFSVVAGAASSPVATYMYYAKNIPAGITSVSFGCTASGDMSATVLEVSGLSPDSVPLSDYFPYDTDYGTGTLPSLSLTYDSTATLFIAQIGFESTATATDDPTPQYTAVNTSTYGNIEAWDGYLIDGSTNAPSWVLNSSVAYAAQGVAFRTVQTGRVLYPDSSTNNAISYATYTAEKSASWDDTSHSSNVAFTSIAKDATVTVSWFASNTPAHNSATFPTGSATVSVDVTSVTAIAAGTRPVYGRRVTTAGGTGPTGSYQSTMDLSTTGIKTSTASSSSINSGTIAASDSLFLYISIAQSGSHTLGAITIDDSDTYFYHPDLVNPSTFTPSRPRTIPGVAVSQSSRW